MTEVKFLGNGEAAIVLGDGPKRATSLDGGRTLEEVDQVAIFRVPLDQIEYVEADQLLSERPELDPETNLPVPSESEIEPIVRGEVAAQSPAPQRTAEQVQAEIEQRQRELDQIEGREFDRGRNVHRPDAQHERAAEERGDAPNLSDRTVTDPQPQEFRGPTPPARA